MHIYVPHRFYTVVQTVFHRLPLISIQAPYYLLLEGSFTIPPPSLKVSLQSPSMKGEHVELFEENLKRSVYCEGFEEN